MIKGEYRGASLGWLMAILVAVGVWALIWGPSDDDPVDDVDPAPTTTSTTTEATLPAGNLDELVLRHSPPFADESPQMAVDGLLILDRGCLLLDIDDGGRSPLIWPAGTTWEHDSSEVVLANGERIQVGARISGSGGAIEQLTQLRQFDEPAREVALRCSEVDPMSVIAFGNNPRFVETVAAPVGALGEGSLDGPVIRWPLPYALGGTDAEVGGVLVLRGECLQFEYGTAAEAGYLPIVWPAGTSWDPDRLEVILPTGDRIGIGATVAGGGGYPYADGLTALDEDGQALASGCAENEGAEVAAFNNWVGAIDVEPAAQQALDGPVVRQPAPYWTEGEGAGINGRLELSDDCLQLPYGDGEHLAIVWPAGTSWDASVQEVVLPSGERVGVGDMVDGGGGYYRPEDFVDLGVEAVDLLDACASNQWREVARFNNQADAARPAG